MIGGFGERCLDVHVYHLCGKQAKKFLAKSLKENRRRRLLFRLIREVRELRRQLSESK